MEGYFGRELKKIGWNPICAADILHELWELIWSVFALNPFLWIEGDGTEFVLLGEHPKKCTYDLELTSLISHNVKSTERNFKVNIWLDEYVTSWSF